ncbi:response regulator [Cupriavidus sp. 30B13]|uniref:response regulator n=1 Tax=Cupriavidus sp. 30B13 TaxID=3384241 RepID=UPI003B90FBA7
MTTVLIVDDHPAMRMVIRTRLSQVLGVSRVLEANNGQSALDIAKECPADLVILDLDIPKVNGLEVIPRLRAMHPQVRILVLSGQDSLTFAPRAMQLGAKGFVSKLQDVSEIMRCVDAVMAGYTLFPPEVGDAEAVPPDLRDDNDKLKQLTVKELVILQMLAKGMSNAAIGKLQFISNKTVSSHKMHIMAKLRVATLVELVDFARRCHVVP